MSLVFEEEWEKVNPKGDPKYEYEEEESEEEEEDFDEED